MGWFPLRGCFSSDRPNRPAHLPQSSQSGPTLLVKSRFSVHEHANGSKVAPASWERKRYEQVLSDDGGAAE